ncbi:MAG: SpoIIE family protein phosphatase [Bacteroidales bacterium]
MTKEKERYRAILTNRNIGLFTLAGFLVVLTGLMGFAYTEETGFSLSRLVEVHRLNSGVFIFDGLPLYIFLILLLARRNMNILTDQYKRKLAVTEKILKQNSDFANTLSEGEDPDTPPEMLETELGKALKLIHLNINSNRKKEREITWITEGKEMIFRVLRLHDELNELSYQILRSLSRYINAVQGAVYLYEEESESLRNISVLAYNRRKYIDQTFRIGEGLAGQCAYEMDYIHRTEIPDDYVTITSGILGDQKPKSILLVPLITNEQLQGIIEFAFLETRIPKLTIQFMLELGEIIARTFFNLRVNEKTRKLLDESREMTAELQKNEQILQENAVEMKATQEQLRTANIELQKRIEQERMAQDRLHWLLKNASEIISIYDDSFRLTYISPSAEHILGYTTEEMMKGKDFERIDQKNGAAIRKAFDHLTQSPDQTVRIEYSFLRKDGQRVFLNSIIRNLLNDPSIGGFLFNTRDITESKLMEKEQRLKSRMQSLSENSLDLIMRISSSGIIHYANPVVEDYSEITPSAMLNKPIGDVPMNKNLAEILNNTLHKVSNNPVKLNIEESLPVTLGEKEGERVLNINVIPEFQERELETILFVGHDVTEAKRIEKEIRITNRKMQDSINYAERIQSSLLPSALAVKRAFPQSFVFYQPRDVISGDIPWFRETPDAWFIAAIDCTGHGVPGALLSFIGFFLLNNITALQTGRSAGEIADELNREVRRTLKQDLKDPETRDGMDIALCKIYKDKERLEFVGAHRPMYLLREGEISVYKGDRKAVGGLFNPRKPEKDFTTIEVNLRKGDKLFIFSDGLTDQLGGPEGMKYSPARIRSILLENPGLTINQFNDYFRKDFNNWLEDEKQIDDVLLIGIEF